MILLTALNDREFYLNPELIYRVEEMPDTLITLIDGKTLVVTESAAETAQRVIDYKLLINSKQINN
ncbi:flagellar FlbD family protein [Enterococcus gallinarum]|uniref:flagellar FlbD family protein n=1 Tax=Enterococcus gallinarum TaxID=1353 RepID=UPI001C60FBAC|nr:flagellar FlbD family protein [Enterococcus gallinarum]MBW5473824.1 endoflagellar protein [Enterococcus gallinarum]UJA22467.1 flagellar FlbD family protein [Enterococcus gallinarum]